MKLKKNVNYHTLIAKFAELNQYSSALANAFTKLTSLFDDNKLGIHELDYKIEEELAYFRNAYTKIEELIRTL